MFDTDLTGLLAVTLSLGMPIIIVVAVLIYKAHQATLTRETIQDLIAKGQQVPPDLLRCLPGSERQAKSPLRTGIILAAVGLGMLFMFLSGPDYMREHWGVSMIPLLLGLGFLLMWKLEGREKQ